MSLIQLKEAQLQFGVPPILDNENLVLHEKERVCIIGRNGCGKSTLLKVIEGIQSLDDGQRILESHIKISRLPQDPPKRTDISVFQYVLQGLGDTGQRLAEYQAFSMADVPHDAAYMHQLSELQAAIDADNGWQLETQVETFLTLMDLDGNASLASLSGGWRRRAALTQAMVNKPDILLLDEPTNHLDIEMIKWLEHTLKQFNGTVLFISHDRAFVRSVATRILDLDRGKLSSFNLNYDDYLLKKSELLDIEVAQQEAFDKKLAQEETWIRQGIKARRTRNEGRVRELKKLRETHNRRIKQQGKANISANSGSRASRRIFELHNLSYAIDDTPILKDFNLFLERGERLALIGKNGCGKSTLIKILLGQLRQDSGKLIEGQNLSIAYFDQNRDTLDESRSVIDEIGDGKRDLMIGDRTRHVMSYLKDYLFSPERANVPVSALSGGEKNRLMLAKLMLLPSNVLILDEPTNDLDVETLELLEDLLQNYPGTVIIVSHDREFVDHVATRCLLFKGDGELVDYVGSATDAVNWLLEQDKRELEGTKVNIEVTKEAGKSVTKKTKKLSYKDARELEMLPAQIEALENDLAAKQAVLTQAGFFDKPHAETVTALDAVTAVQNELDLAYARWDELEALQANLQED